MLSAVNSTSAPAIYPAGAFSSWIFTVKVFPSSAISNPLINKDPSLPVFSVLPSLVSYTLLPFSSIIVTLNSASESFFPSLSSFINCSAKLPVLTGSLTAAIIVFPELLTPPKYWLSGWRYTVLSLSFTYFKLTTKLWCGIKKL